LSDSEGFKGELTDERGREEKTVEENRKQQRSEVQLQ
jgi:hypothetical protein